MVLREPIFLSEFDGDASYTLQRRRKALADAIAE